MNKTKLAKAVAFAIAGAALAAGSVSTASASSTTSYNLFHADSQGMHLDGSAIPCAPCAAGTTDGWVYGGIGAGPGGSATPGFVGIGGSSTPSSSTPFGYVGGGSLNWALQLNGGGSAVISNADSIARYNVSADIDTAQGAWSDASLTGAAGWRHDLDFGLFKSDVSGLVTLNAQSVNGDGLTPDLGFTIFKGMDTSTSAYNHHGAWNADTNTQPGAPTSASLPGGGRNLPVSSIVAFSIGGATPSNLNNISFVAEAGQIYTIAIGGYKNGSWNTTTDGYKLSVSQVPVPGAVWLFGSAMAGLVGFGRRKLKNAA
jgi:hypothetical protein